MLITVYAALSNTLLVSLLVAILSGTYASIAADAVSTSDCCILSLADCCGERLYQGCGRHVSQSRHDFRRCQVRFTLRLYVSDETIEHIPEITPELNRCCITIHRRPSSEFGSSVRHVANLVPQQSTLVSQDQ